MHKKEKFIIWVLSAILVIELIILFALVYFAKFEVFFFLFISGLKFISPFFLLLNIIFLISTIFVKGIDLTSKFWRTYLIDYLRFFILSLAFAALLITISAFLGVLLGISLIKVYSISSFREFMDSLRNWVSRQFY